MSKEWEEADSLVEGPAPPFGVRALVRSKQHGIHFGRLNCIDEKGLSWGLDLWKTYEGSSAVYGRMYQVYARDVTHWADAPEEF